MHFMKNRWFQNLICIILIAAIALGLLLPAGMLNTAQLQDPLKDVRLQDIQSLLLGRGEEQQQESAQGSAEDEAENPSDETPSDETVEQETKPEQSQPEQTESTTPDTGDGDEGQEDGLQGEEGGEEAELDLAMVMTWYKYGTQPKTIVCGPSGAVSKSINTAQLLNQNLKYSFSLTGEEAENVQITAVNVKAGDAAFSEVSSNGSISIQLPLDGSVRDYTFQIDTQLKKRDAQGKQVEQQISFTYVLHCSYSMDLEMELIWNKAQDSTGTIRCAANDSAAKTVESHELTENVFTYTPKLVGALAENTQLLDGEYTTASGLSGKLHTGGGSLVFQVPSGAEKETYFLVFSAQITHEDNEKQTVYFHYTLDFAETLDLDLSFTWLERGVTRRTAICQPNGKSTITIKNNQLSAGAVKYEMALTGEDAQAARILNITYTSEATGGGKLEAAGALPVSLPDGYISNTYTILVVVLAGGKQLNFQIALHYCYDAQLEMVYSVTENGVTSDRIVVCENGKSKTAEAIYDDQLPDGSISYTMNIIGSTPLTITSVSCYQSGTGKTVSLNSTDTVSLCLKDGKTGENTFTVLAEDTEKTVYEFKINIPYKHRGTNSVKISTNMTDGQVVINETNTNLSVSAWSEDASGNIVSYIPANGVDTKLIVTLDGEQISYVSSSGPASEYILYPKNPDVGDTNEHILQVYAEDPFGNFGELTLTLKGQRNQAGQKKGTATIYVDMTALGLGVVDSVSYEVLADEPISYSIAKAVLGMDTGDPFGASAESLGWTGKYSGTLDNGFYLQSLTTGLTANALEESPWSYYGASEEEILQSIDQRFGKGTGLATLWRCIYRNGLNKSTGSGTTYGEHDYTNGSGWLFSLNGTYYPGLAMSEYSLENGDVLTLRYTLAYGWDVGGGTAGYGNTIGYCVTALNGSYYINHQMEQIENPDGSVSYVCHCCGLVEACAHSNAAGKDLGDGTHITYCEDCKTAIGDPEVHIWECTDVLHTCTVCGISEAHTWKEVEGSNTATCTEPGIRTVKCAFCETVMDEANPANGHTFNNRWNHTKTEHYQKCSACEEIIAESAGAHQYEYDAGDDDWYCKVCDAGHDWDYCGNHNLTIQSSTCRKIVYYCGECGLNLVKEGNFPDDHTYENGSCIHCGTADPEYVPGQPEPTDPAPSEPEEDNTTEETPPEETNPTQPDPGSNPSEPAPPESEPTEPLPEETDPTDTSSPEIQE